MIARSGAITTADRGSTDAVADKSVTSTAEVPVRYGANAATGATNRRGGHRQDGERSGSTCNAPEEQEDSDGTVTEEKGQRDEREEERAPPGM